MLLTLLVLLAALDFGSGWVALVAGRVEAAAADI